MQWWCNCWFNRGVIVLLGLLPGVVVLMIVLGVGVSSGDVGAG